jgi:hypothetical protein
MWMAASTQWPWVISNPEWYRSGSYFQDTVSMHPDKLDCGIPAAVGLDKSFRIDIFLLVRSMFPPALEKQVIQLLFE